MNQSERHVWESASEPPNGVYPTLDEWAAVLKELARREAAQRDPFQQGINQCVRQARTNASLQMSESDRLYQLFLQRQYDRRVEE
jgi:hypothetical protein